MMQGTSYDHEFPPLQEFQTKNYRHMHKIPNPTDRYEKANQKKASAAEAVLNWQTDNSFHHNVVLIRIENKIDQVSQHFEKNLVSLQNIILELQTRIFVVDQQL